MSNKKPVISNKTVVFSIIGIAALSRLLPHPPNFTPIAAIALFGAAYISRVVWALVIPFLALWISNLFLNNIVYARMYPEYYNGFTWFGEGSGWIYGSFAAIVILGIFLLQKVNINRLVAGSLLASAIFFLISNFGVWWVNFGGMYSPGVDGLVACYVAAIPFFLNTLAGNVFFTGVLFGSFYFLNNRSLALQPHNG